MVTYIPYAVHTLGILIPNPLIGQSPIETVRSKFEKQVPHNHYQLTEQAAPGTQHQPHEALISFRFLARISLR